MPQTQASPSDPLIVTLDIGTSSVRTLLFDGRGRQQSGFGEQISYELTTPAGVAEVPADRLFDLSIRCLSKIHEQVGAAGIRPVGIGCSTFWHGLLGVDRDGNPTTPLFYAFDTRSAQHVRQLEQRLDTRQVHARTGCRLHSSYWPAKLFWLHHASSNAFAATDRWIGFGEYLFLRLFGAAIASTSMVSATGLWHQSKNDYDEEVLRALPIDKLHVAPFGEMDLPQTRLLDPYRSLWPAFDGIPWFPALGDGACDNIGSGCITKDKFALKVGTSSAMRAVVDGPIGAIPQALWCYRVDRGRYILGGGVQEAALESVALGLREIFELMCASLGSPKTIGASGDALQSPASRQMLADIFGMNLTTCLEPETTSRGAALLTLERLGLLRNLEDAPPRSSVIDQGE